MKRVGLDLCLGNKPREYFCMKEQSMVSHFNVPFSVKGMPTLSFRVDPEATFKLFHNSSTIVVAK